MNAKLARCRTGYNFVSFFLGARMVYLAPMELQTQIDELKAKVAQLEALLNDGNPRFGIITCDEWRVVDKDGKVRIAAMTLADGHASVSWWDKDGNLRIGATTFPDGKASVSWWDKDGKFRIGATTFPAGEASVSWLDKDSKLRIGATTFPDGRAGVQWCDKDGKVRINAGTTADGTVVLPT